MDGCHVDGRLFEATTHSPFALLRWRDGVGLVRHLLRMLQVLRVSERTCENPEHQETGTHVGQTCDDENDSLEVRRETLTYVHTVVLVEIVVDDVDGVLVEIEGISILLGLHQRVSQLPLRTTDETYIAIHLGTQNTDGRRLLFVLRLSQTVDMEHTSR